MQSLIGNGRRHINQTLTISASNFEVQQKFTYLRSSVNSKKIPSEEIKRRLATANKCYFRLTKHFKSRRLSRKTKIHYIEP